MQDGFYNRSFLPRTQEHSIPEILQDGKVEDYPGPAVDNAKPGKQLDYSETVMDDCLSSNPINITHTELLFLMKYMIRTSTEQTLRFRTDHLDKQYKLRAAGSLGIGLSRVYTVAILTNRNSRPIKVGQGPSVLAAEILQDAPCEAKFCKTTAGNQRKIASYNFSRAEPYLPQLEPNPSLEAIFKGPGTSGIEIPVFVGGCSSNHFHENLGLIRNLNTVLRPAYPTMKLFFYDLGLQPNQVSQLKGGCNCTVVPFPFDKFPSHVKDLFGYCWKPLIIQLMLQTYRFVMWMDTSVRFKTSDLDPLFIQAKEQGVMSKHDVHRLPSHILADTFLFLQEQPCLFRNCREFEAALLLFHSDNRLTYDYIFQPWVKCALVEDCMKTKQPTGGWRLYCRSHKVYHSCHRYDQAILSLLLYRLFPDTYMDHHIDEKYYQKGEIR